MSLKQISAASAAKTRTATGGRRPDDAVWGAVCDGMGGARGGRLASTMAVDALQQAIEAGIDEAHTPQAGRALLESAVEQANRSVYEKARGTPSLSGMGTTVVCALVRGGLAQYVHVGDSPHLSVPQQQAASAYKKTIPWCRRWWSRAR